MKFVPPPEKKRVKADLIRDFASIARADGKGRKYSNTIFSFFFNL
jgi:hypothetical protein